MAISFTGRRCACARRAWLASLAVGLMAASAAAAGELDTSQRTLLNDAISQLEKARSGLKLVQDALGRGNTAPTGSKRKLALVRLNSAKQPLATAAERLAKLPGDHPDVQTVQQHHDALKQTCDQFETLLTGEASTNDDTDDAGVKLDYRQEESLKNARFNLRDLKGRVQPLTELVEQAKGVDDKTTLDHRIIAQGIATVADARRRAGFVQDHLDALPNNGAGVAPVAKELADTVQVIDACEAFLSPIHQQLSEILNPHRYPELNADTTRLDDLASMFPAEQLIDVMRIQAAEAFKQAPAAAAEHDRVVTKYGLLMRQRTREGELLNQASRSFLSSYQAYLEAVERQKAKLPGEITGHLAEARDIGRQAVEEQKPLFFTGGVVQNMDFARDKLAFLKAIDPDGAKAADAEFAKTEVALKEAQEALRETIIQTNTLPADNYTNDDRGDIEEWAKQAWRERKPKAKILAVRVPSSEWKHEVMWRYSSGTWHKIDRSRIQAQLIVQHDERLATIQPIDLWKNHLSNDQVTAYPFWEEDAELPPSSFLPLEKVK